MSRSETEVSRERITYLVANYNQSAYIADCMESLRCQTDRRWMALVCDDRSTDGSLEVVGPYVDRDQVRLLVNPRNVGYTVTLQRLLEAAETDIVGILDPDDALAPKATERVLTAYAADPECGFVYTRFARFDRDLSERLGVAGFEIPAGRTTLESGGIGHLRTFRRSAYGKTSGLDPDLTYAEDRDLVYKLEEIAQPVFIDEVLYFNRELPDSQSRSPAKREIGARSHLRGQRAALRRRGVGGGRALFWRLVFLCDYVLYSHRFHRTVKAPNRVSPEGAEAAGGELESRAGGSRVWSS